MTEPVDDFEIDAVAIKETETALLKIKMELAFEAKSRKAGRWLAHLWACSPQAVNTLARMFETFSADDILPNVPLSLYNAVMETGDPRYALHLATDYEFRRQELGEGFAKADKQGIWSSSDLRRFYDIKKGRHYASDKVEAIVEITVWDSVTGDFAATGMPLSGAPPKRARVTVRGVLE